MAALVAAVVLLSAGCMLLGLCCWRLRRRGRQLLQARALLQTERDAALGCLRAFLAGSEGEAAFAGVLDQSSLATRLQLGAEGGGEVPKKYEHVLALASHGMGAGEISRILEISVAEAEQLVRLSRTAGADPGNS